MELMRRAGREQVPVTAIDIATPFADFDAYWRPFLGGQGPTAAYAMSLETPARAHLRKRLRECVPVATDGSIGLTAPP